MNGDCNLKRVYGACNFLEHHHVNRPAKIVLLASLSLFAPFAGGVFPAAANAAEADRGSIVERVAADIRYLASDELEGRGPDTGGLEKAAQYILGRFESLGLRVAAEDGPYWRPFEIPVGTNVVPAQTSLVLRGPQGEELKLELGQDYQPLAVGGGGKVQAEVVFAGYGISAPQFKYDDYQGADVAGKVVLIVRREPQQGDPQSVFDGKQTTRHSFVPSKLQAAQNNKAAAILLVNDPYTTEQEKKDQLTPPGGFGTAAGRVPFVHLTQQVVDQLLNKSPVKAADEDLLTSVQAIGEKIDQTMTPLTQPLGGWTAELELTFETVKANVANVVGVIEGQGPLANETIVVGAHYDHIGYGPFGSAPAPGTEDP